MKVSIDKLKINPEYERLVPPLSKEEYEDLKEGIKREGLRISMPISVNKENIVLDGHHRYRICKELNIKDVFVEYETFENKLEEKLWVINANLRRRNLSTVWRAKLGIEREKIYKEIGKERMKQGGEIGGGLAGRGRPLEKSNNEKPSESSSFEERPDFSRIYETNSEKEEFFDKKEDFDRGLLNSANPYQNGSFTQRNNVENNRISSRKSAANDAHVSEDSIWKWQKIEAWAETNERIKALKKEAEKDNISLNKAYTEALKIIKVSKPKKKDLIPLPKGKYRTIVIDPPWEIEKIRRDVRPNQTEMEYKTMSVEEIKKFPITEIFDKSGCHVYLWTTHKHLPDALEIFKAWGVKYQCVLTWIKNVGITPFSWMYSTELVLFGRVGNLPLLRNGLRIDFRGKVREHSRKPDEFYELVKQASPEPRIDVFSREKREGFDQYGDEINKFKNDGL